MANEPASRLGRGLSSMVSEGAGIKAGTSAAAGSGFLRIPWSEIREPASGRRADPALIDSVRKFGVLQPVLVARSESGYDLLAGARRLNAARAAGLADIPALIIPPDRAGSLDVFLDENLMRAELEEDDRIRLREDWMRATGRDQEQAEARIPEVQWESIENTPEKSPRVWMVAAGVLAVVSSVLLLMVFSAKPVDRRPVVIPVEFVAAPPEPEIAPPPPTDISWMEPFRFPGNQREMVGEHLILMPGQRVAENNQLTPTGKLFLNQLAAITLSSDRLLTIEIIAGGADPATTLPHAAMAASHLIQEGVPAVQMIFGAGIPGRINDDALNMTFVLMP